MSAPWLVVYSDVISRCQAWARAHGADIPSVDTTTIRASIETALREIVTLRDWTCMYKIHRIQLQAAYSTGTIAYQAAEQTIDGTSFPCVVTLTGGTFPDNAIDWVIRIGTTICEILYVSADGSQLALRSPLIPTVDYAAGTSYMAGPRWYALPPEFVASWSPAEKNAWFVGQYIPFEDFFLIDKYRALTGIVRRWTIGPIPDLYGAMAIYVYPWSQTNDEEDMFIKIRPRELRISGTDPYCFAGTVSIPDGGMEVTGVRTAFNSNMVGSVIRFSDTTAMPTGTAGINPYVFQTTINAVSSNTSVTLSQAAPQAFSAVKYVVSDPVDISQGIYDLFLRACEKQLATACGMKDIKTTREAFEEAKLAAQIADDPVRQKMLVGRPSGVKNRLRDFLNRPVIFPGG
jgi:hypothetical protein